MIFSMKVNEHRLMVKVLMTGYRVEMPDDVPVCQSSEDKAKDGGVIACFKLLRRS